VTRKSLADGSSGRRWSGVAHEDDAAPIDRCVESSTSVLVVTIYQLTLVMTLLPLSAIGSHLGLRRIYHTSASVAGVPNIQEI
jgi:hypothetical protein